MNRHALAMSLAISLAVIVVIAGCSSSDNSGTPAGNSGSRMGRDGRDSNSGRGMPGQPGSSQDSYSSDGERIFLGGVGTDGGDIARTAPGVSEGSLMMGGGGCGSCHGADGRGGTIRMMAGTAIAAPDIRYDELVAEGFTDTSIAVAVRDGVDEKGEPLDVAMPRWQMSDADVDATIAYLKVLSAQ